MSSVVEAPSRKVASSCAIAGAAWPPSVRVWIWMRPFIDRLRAARIGATTNFYREGAGAALRCERLCRYLDARSEATLLLVGEAPGYRGARVSGLPFTS